MKKYLKFIIPAAIIIVMGIMMYGYSGSMPNMSEMGAQHMRSSAQGGRRSSAQTSGGDTSSGYYIYSNKSSQSDAEIAGNNINIDGNNIGVGINDVKAAGDKLVGAINDGANAIAGALAGITGGDITQYYNPQPKWDDLVRSYSIDSKRVNDLYGGRSFTIRDAVYDNGVIKSKDGDLPYVVFSRNQMKAYMYFTEEHGEEVEKLRKALPVTVSGGMAVFERDTLYLYGCTLGY